MITDIINKNRKSLAWEKKILLILGLMFIASSFFVGKMAMKHELKNAFESIKEKATYYSEKISTIEDEEIRKIATNLYYGAIAGIRATVGMLEGAIIIILIFGGINLIVLAMLCSKFQKILTRIKQEYEREKTSQTVVEERG